VKAQKQTHLMPFSNLAEQLQQSFFSQTIFDLVQSIISLNYFPKTKILLIASQIRFNPRAMVDHDI
jgi:hypothetical protein